MQPIIYTAILGSYDILRNPRYIDKNFDYLCFTDTPDICNGLIWEPREVSVNDDTYMSAKEIKVKPWKFINTDKSIWVDGNLIIRTDISVLFDDQHDICFCEHPVRKCAYEEARVVVERKKETEAAARLMAKIMKDDQYPEDNGLIYGGLIVRKHTKLMQEAMEAWWERILISRRDQLSWNYVAWKYGYPFRMYNNRVYNYHFKMFAHDKKIIIE